MGKSDDDAKQRDLAVAIECFDRALAQNPRAVRAFIHKGNALSHRTRHEDVIGTPPDEPQRDGSHCR